MHKCLEAMIQKCTFKKTINEQKKLIQVLNKPDYLKISIKKCMYNSLETGQIPKKIELSRLKK